MSEKIEEGAVRNELTAIKYVGKDDRRQRVWLWKCSCGVLKEIREHHVRNGNIKSCGCYPRRFQGKTEHGMSHSREYKTWCSMKERCSNPSATNYYRYGGSGVKVCERWMTFGNFYNDMGPRPEGTTLDRINGDDNYEPGNCRWATRKEQNDNRKNTIWLEHNNMRMTINDWAKHFGISRHWIYRRVRINGWSAEKTLTTAAENAMLKQGEA